MRKLFDSDGENRAVRGFLMGLEVNCKTFAAMRQHLTAYGFAHWPEHFNVAQGHITKAEQQEWLRHLFALESIGTRKEGA